jgi:uncharacterized RDD family membrane protein YckC
MAALLVVALASGLAANLSSGAGTALLIVDLVAVVLIVLAYPIAWETLWHGRTLGKAAMGLRVVTVEGAPIRFRHALVRGLLGLIDLYALGPEVGVLTILISRRDQRLGDLAAGTLVVRERSGARPTAPATFWAPPGWEAYVEQFDVSGVSAAAYETVRAYLLRTGELAPAARASLAGRLTATLAARVTPAPMPGLPPELWLRCVAAAYQRRHGAPPAWSQPVWGQPASGQPTWVSAPPAPTRPPPPPPPAPHGPPPAPTAPPPPPAPTAPTPDEGFRPPA